MKYYSFSYVKIFFLTFVVTTLSACGGGSTVPTVPTVPTTSIEWQQGVYPEASLLKDYCETPRVSTTNASYPDQDGSNFLEKMWLRSWSNDVYLWYRELSDIDVDFVGSPQDYFDTRKTFATTVSGVARDQFHFYRDSEEYNQQVSSGASIGYGMTFKLISTLPPRKVVVLYVEPGSPADLANIARGAEIINIDGADLIEGEDIDTLINGLYPDTANESHLFQIQNIGDASPITVSMESTTISESPVQNTQYYTETTTGEKVGYLTFNTFGTYNAEASLANAFSFLENEGVSDLVLDLRYNGGGFLAISSQLAYMIAGPDNTENKTYYKPVFNDKYPNTNPISGEQIQSYPFFDTGLDLTVSSNSSLPTLNLNRVYVLTSDDTCSASEAVMNGLQGIGVEVIQIGGKTCGKPYGFVGTDNCGTTYFTVTFKGVNDLGAGDYADGFYPANSSDIGSIPVAGCEVADDLSHPLGDLDEAMLNAALSYRDSGSCPAQSAFRSAQKSISSSNGKDLLTDSRLRSDLMLKNALLLQ